MYSDAQGERGVRFNANRRNWTSTSPADLLRSPPNWRSVTFKASSPILLTRPMVTVRRAERCSGRVLFVSRCSRAVIEGTQEVFRRFVFFLRLTFRPTGLRG